MLKNHASAKNKQSMPAADGPERLIVKLIFIVYWLLIFEGALRKWIFPQANKLLFFIRDPFTLYIYYLAFRYDLWPRSSVFLKVGLILAAIFIPLILMQSIIMQDNLLVGIYGWRNYFFYLPLAFIIGRVFQGKDLFRLIRQTLLVSVPIALLVFWQFKSPPQAFINRSYDPEAAVYLIAKNVVRPTGTFTFSQGQTIFACSIVAMLLAVWITPKAQRPLGLLALITCSVAALANVAFSGSRGVFFSLVFSLASAFLAGSLLVKNAARKAQLMAIPVLLIVFGSILYVTVFEEAFGLMVQRQEVAVRGEGSTLDRAFHSMSSVTEVLPEITLLGRGVGLGSNAGAFLAAGTRQFLLYEEEWPRLVQEAGPLGLTYIGYRLALAIWLAQAAITAVKRSGNPLPILLLSFTLPILILGPMTLQGTANGFGWLFTGFSIAANNLRLSRSERA